MDQAKKMAKIAFEALEDKKGENVCAIDISSVSVLADYFVIANGNSDSQVRALVENVEEKMHKAGYELKEQEGICCKRDRRTQKRSVGVDRLR